MEINKELIDKLFKEAMASERKRMNFDLRTPSLRQAQDKLGSGQASSEDGSQRMLNALLPGTEVAIHKHPNSTESIMCLTGDLDVVLYAEVSPTEWGNRLPPEGEQQTFPRSEFSAEVMRKRTLVEKERIHLCPDFLTYGCTVPKDTWHTVDVHLPSVIFEAKDGKYGEDGSVSFQ